VFALLNGISRSRGSKLTELAGICDLPVTSTHRLLVELVNLGVVERESDRYHLGPVLFELGLKASSQSDLLKASRPHLYELHAETRQAVYLAVLADSDILVVDVVANPAQMASQVRNGVGSRLPAHPTSTGKSLIAFGACAGGRVALRRVGPRTITHPTLFAEQMQAARAAGFTTECEETRAGIASVGAPIYCGTKVVGAIGVCAPTYSFKARQLGAQVRSAAHNASGALTALVECDDVG
jgi:DNA-binding IclR family transcriptional regulator